MPGLSGGRPLIEIGLISVFLIVLSTSVSFAEAQTLRKGDKGQNVGAVQFLLRFRGIAGVRADLVFSENTESAVRQFQSQRGLTIDGSVGPLTLQTLFGGILIKPQSSGDDVRAVQTLVCIRDKAKCTRTATMDAESVNAVKAYQKSKSLPADGIVGDKTWAALFGISLASSSPPPAPVPRPPVPKPATPTGASPIPSTKSPVAAKPPPPTTTSSSFSVPTQSHYDFIMHHEGWGHLVTKDELPRFQPGTCLSRSVCLDILKKDTAIAASCITSNVKVPLACNQYGATLSFIFNLGCGSYKSSGFFRNTNNKNYKAAGENMKLWNKAGQPPRVVTGLVNRRADEVALWSAADSTRCFS